MTPAPKKFKLSDLVDLSAKIAGHCMTRDGKPAKQASLWLETPEDVEGVIAIAKTMKLLHDNEPEFDAFKVAVSAKKKAVSA